MGLMEWLKHPKGRQGAGSAPPAHSTRQRAPETLTRLWHATDGRDVNALVDSLRDEEVTELVAWMDLSSMPLNAFCTQAFNLKGLDDRMVATTLVALRLLERDREVPLLPLLEKVTAKAEEKVRRGGSPEGASFDKADPWRMGESLMTLTHGLAIGLLKREHDAPAAALLHAIVMDYPGRLESRFWLASARHNLFMQKHDAESRQLALEAIDGFLQAAAGHADYRNHIDTLAAFRSSEY